MTPNSYLVPKSQWKKWDDKARYIFNEVYAMMSENQRFFLHPKAAKADDKHWTTTAWNAAWTAADAYSGVDAVAERKAA